MTIEEKIKIFNKFHLLLVSTYLIALLIVCFEISVDVILVKESLFNQGWYFLLCVLISLDFSKQVEKYQKFKKDKSIEPISKFTLSSIKLFSNIFLFLNLFDIVRFFTVGYEYPDDFKSLAWVVGTLPLCIIWTLFLNKNRDNLLDSIKNN